MSYFKTIGAIMLTLGLICLISQIATASGGPRLKTIKELVDEAQEGVEFITIDTMKDSIKNNDKLILLDVRTEKEYQAAHIKGATWLERGIAEFVLARALPIQEAEIVVYCKGGNRSGLVVKALKSAGYRNVVGLKGGFDEWASQGNSVYNFLGEFKMVKLAPINASSFKAEFYEDKSNP